LTCIYGNAFYYEISTSLTSQPATDWDEGKVVVVVIPNFLPLKL